MVANGRDLQPRGVGERQCSVANGSFHNPDAGPVGRKRDGCLGGLPVCVLRSELGGEGDSRWW